MPPTSIRPGIGPGGAPPPALSLPLQWSGSWPTTGMTPRGRARGGEATSSRAD